MNLAKLRLLFLVFLLSIPAFSSLSLAQLGSNFPQFPFQTWYSPEALAQFLGIKQEWLVVPQVIYYVIIPFIVAVTVTYGILTELKIFRGYNKGKINIILAVAMSFLLLPSGILTTIVNYFYAFNTFFGLIGFGLLFLFGVIVWMYGTGHRIWGEQVPPNVRYSRLLRQDVEKLNHEIDRLDEQIAAAKATGQTDRVTNLQNKRTEKETKRTDLNKKLETLRYG